MTRLLMYIKVGDRAIIKAMPKGCKAVQLALHDPNNQQYQIIDIDPHDYEQLHAQTDQIMKGVIL